RAPTYVESDVAAVRPTQLLKRLQESCVAGLDVRVVSGAAVEHADASYASILLCGRRGRPSHRSSRRAAEKPNEVAPSHCLPRSSGQGIVAAQTCTGKGLTDVRFGSWPSLVYKLVNDSQHCRRDRKSKLFCRS